MKYHMCHGRREAMERGITRLSFFLPKDGGEKLVGAFEIAMPAPSVMEALREGPVHLGVKVDLHLGTDISKFTVAKVGVDVDADKLIIACRYGTFVLGFAGLGDEARKARGVSGWKWGNNNLLLKSTNRYCGWRLRRADRSKPQAVGSKREDNRLTRGGTLPE